MEKIEKKGIFPLSLPPSTVEKLDRVARQEDMSRSAVARQAIKEYLERRTRDEIAEEKYAAMISGSNTSDMEPDEVCR